MKYFIDFEFHERFEKRFHWFGQPRHIIEPISIGIVCEDGREYYAIFKDFDFKAAWKQDFLRGNVLPNLDKFTELATKGYETSSYSAGEMRNRIEARINLVGKTREQVARDIQVLINPGKDFFGQPIVSANPTFYGYYSDYDWVVFCSLFGTMMELPRGYPMYCIDLKQDMDRIAAAQQYVRIDCVKFNIIEQHKLIKLWSDSPEKNILEKRKSLHKDPVVKSTKKSIQAWPFESKLQLLKCQKNYPQQIGEHNALADARWNFELYEFLNKI